MELRPQVDKNISSYVNRNKLSSKAVAGANEEKKKEHDLKTPRTSMKDETRLQPNTKYLESTADQLESKGAKNETDSWSVDAQSNGGRNTRSDGRETRLYL